MVDRSMLLAAVEKRQSTAPTIDLTDSGDEGGEQPQKRSRALAGGNTKVELVGGIIVRSEQPSRQKPANRAKPEARSPASSQPGSSRCLPASDTPAAAKVRVTTSGFHPYIAKEMSVYNQSYSCLELNVTYYRTPEDSTWRGWCKKAPRQSFQYVVKVNKYFTHMKKLNIDADWIQAWQDFWRKCQLLGPHLGPVLFQFPPFFAVGTKKGAAVKLDALRQLAEVLDPSHHFVFEFRHTSWYCAEVYQVLAENDWCLANIHAVAGFRADVADSKSWLGELPDGCWPRNEAETPPCSWGFYRRLHGTAGQYVGGYGDDLLSGYMNSACIHAAEGRTSYIAFNNTDSPDLHDMFSGRHPPRCHAETNSHRCAELLRSPGGPWA